METDRQLPTLRECFGIRGAGQVRRDVGHFLGRTARGSGFNWGVRALEFLRPYLSLPAYAGLVRSDGISPIYHFFDRTTGGREYRNRITRSTARDFRGGRLTYDDHDGTDFVCPPGTPLGAAAPGVLVAYRDSWLRGGLTATVDHGHGVTTQYSHLCRAVAAPGQSLRRGEVVGLSGVSGIDLVTGFPWVPPHLHFMVWVDGRPVDPCRARGETRRPGQWWPEGRPEIIGSVPDDPEPPALEDIEVSRSALEEIISRCRDHAIRREVARAPSAAARLAVCVDSLHHERWAWPEGIDASILRPKGDPEAVRLTVPLPSDLYRGVAPADTVFSRP